MDCHLKNKKKLGITVIPHALLFSKLALLKKKTRKKSFSAFQK